MGFLRSKSRGTGEEAEQKKRNRLSKPLTNRAGTNSKAVAKPELGNLDTEKSQSQLDLEEIIQSPTVEESRAKVRLHLFEKDTSPVPSLSSRDAQLVTQKGVAQLVARYEGGQPKSVAPPRSRELLVNKRSNQPSLDLRAQPSSESRLSNPIGRHAKSKLSHQTTRSPVEDQMWDQLQTRFSTPERRDSNPISAETTRKLHHESSFDVKYDDRNSITKADNKDDDNISETWTAPAYPTESRPGTPTSLEPKALGNWSFGSLRVTNGRVSPDMSVVSSRCQLDLTVSRSRDVSSEYADSEAWEDDVAEGDSDTTSTGCKTPTTDLKREFSFAQGAEERLAVRMKSQTLEEVTEDLPTTPISKSPAPPLDLAEEYMAELPASPFAELTARSSPASTGSIVHHTLNSSPDGHGGVAASGPYDQSRSHNRVISNESQASSNGSQPSTVVSKFSSNDSQYAQDDVFQSALEFQHFQALPSPKRPNPPFMMNDVEKSDSGYSSVNSVKSFQTSDDHSKISALESVPEQTKILSTKENSPRKLGGFLPLRPAMKSRNTAPTTVSARDPRPETSQSLDPAPAVTNLEAASPIPMGQAQTPPSKQRKKLQKIKPFEKLISRQQPPPPPEEVVVVQRNLSAETYNIPFIPPQTLASLDVRVQKLPELEKTVQNHNKQSSSSSILEVPDVIRFPTPNPEPVEEERRSRKSRARSKSRPRSKSRRRSMLEFFTGNRDDNRKSINAETTPELNINDLGDVVSALGTNPYDIATPYNRSRSHSRVHSETHSINHHSEPWPHSMDNQFSRNITPHRLSYPSSGRRYMMDDQTASAYARNRSRSIHERDHWNDQPDEPVSPVRSRSPPHRQAFNDRGGIPGKNMRSLCQSEDAPPMPPMPSRAEIRRLSGRYDDNGNPRRSHRPGSFHWDKDDSRDFNDTTPPPLPPPHSPRPVFVDTQELDFPEPEDLSLAPPPPCHSPRPMDLEPEPVFMSDHGWADQANAWRARRQSAGENLRSKWGTPGSLHENNFAEHNNAYPHIPPRTPTNYFDGSENWPPPGQPLHEWHNNAHHRSHSHHSTDQWLDDQYHGYQYHDLPYGAYDSSHGYYEDSQYQHDARGGWHEDQPYHDVHEQDPHHREPSPAPSRPLPSRPGSRISYRSDVSAISLAEELNPEVTKRPSPAPSFGRYSGGLQFSYEGKNKGFGGSSGTRSVSGTADAQWKGVALKQTFGVDLGDVPIMGVVKPLR